MSEFRLKAELRTGASSEIDHRDNNFDFVRLMAAVLVVFSHSFNLLAAPSYTDRYGEPLNVLTDGQMSFGNLGVVIFFTISGYLITQSMARSDGYRTFFVKRFLRIFPALILDLLISVFIFGTLVTTLSLYEYFTDPLTFRYLLNICLYKISFILPGVFESNINQRYVNGSLWTLPYEFTCYIGVAALWYLSIMRNKYRYAAFYAVCVLVGFYGMNTKFRILDLPFTDVTYIPLFRLSLYFGMGALYYQFRENIKFYPLVALLLLIVLAVTSHFYLLDYSGFLCIPYIVLWFVNERRIPLQNAGRFGDFSYGMYIYGAPVQQTIVHFSHNNIGVPSMVVLSFGFTILLAVFSWFVVEKRALKFKDRLAASWTSGTTTQ